MKIAVDAMGGDRAPQVVVDGVVMALEEYKNIEIILVGKMDKVEKLIAGRVSDPARLTLLNAEEVIEMHETPAVACMKKKDSSIMVAASLMKNRKVEAVISAGNTGAVACAHFLEVGRLKGISRPALAALIPSARGMSVLIDVGANVDCKPKHLYQFAIMGSVYSEYILKVDKPRVGLLSIGEEESKGNELTFSTMKLLKENTHINFIGNVEGRDIVNGRADVIVCDGFLGNVVVKFGESIAEMVFRLLKEEIMKKTRYKLAAALMKPVFRGLKKKVDYEEYGGAPLLGVNGVCIISHGGSTAKAIKNTIRVAAEFVKNNVNGHIIKDLS